MLGKFPKRHEGKMCHKTWQMLSLSQAKRTKFVALSEVKIVLCAFWSGFKFKCGKKPTFNWQAVNYFVFLEIQSSNFNVLTNCDPDD
jgi:hypothetical protein